MQQKEKISLYERCCRILLWIDNKEITIPIFRRKSKSDAFAEKMIAEIEKTIGREKFSYEDGKTLIPTRYIVYLNEEDSAEWYGMKLDFLRHKADLYVTSRLRMISQKSFNDHFVWFTSVGDVRRGAIKVLHQWEESESPININVRECVLFAQEEKAVFTTDAISAEFADDDEYETLIGARAATV